MANCTLYVCHQTAITLRTSRRIFLMSIFMSNAPNYLRLYRKRSPLTQSDIAYLLQMPDVSNVSRYEKGQRNVNLMMLLAYHHLFRVSIEDFFEQDSYQVKINILDRATSLSTYLKDHQDLSSESRIKYLEETIIRLTN